MGSTAGPQEPIAVIGVGCRFPGGADRPSKLWDLLRSPPDLTRKPPASRFNIDGFYNADGEYHGGTNAPSSYFLDEDVSRFDNEFFNVTPKEAEAMDPQQRLLLETVYEAMESAGLSIKGMEGSQTAVYVGLMCLDWCEVQLRDINFVSQYMGTGAHRSILSNRVSYFYDWKGPSMTIDTACSSSLVAVHEAVRSLRSRESNIACAAGANLLLGPEGYIVLSNLHMLSPTGRSRMWDAGADGYARGEAIGVLMLKRLSDAIADGDRIEAVIRETGVNSDGRTKGITMPSNVSQSALVRDTYRRAGLDVNKPSDRPQYFEAHGTGTQAGDLQEATAISNSFFGEEEGQVEQKLVVGSIKTVVGHTEGAAGIAGVIKAILAMKHGTIPPNKHLVTLNPVLEPFMKYLKVPTALEKWPAMVNGVPRRASINSFGFGGTNAHAIVELFDPSIHSVLPSIMSPTDNKVSRVQPLRTIPKLPLLFSASSETALLQSVQQYADLLRETPNLNLQDLAWTLQARRSALTFKMSISNSDRETVLQQMDDACRDVEGLGFRARLVSGDASARLLGVFTGQGAQWATMGAKLIQHSWLFRQTFESLETALAGLSDAPKWSLKAELLAPAGASRVGEAAISQPICTAVQVALLDVLAACGIKFRAVVGHSSGEIAAAYAAGYLSARDAICIAYYRGFYAHLARGKDGNRGLMMATGLSRKDASDLCSQKRFRGRMVVAASNSSTSVTLSGDADAIKEAQKELSATGTFARLLQVDTAYHSPHMHAAAVPYVAALKACGVSPTKPSRRGIWFSSAQDHHRDPKIEDLKGDYWRDNMAGTVFFTEALRKAVETAGPFDACLEVGPHPALKGPATQTIKEVSPETGAYFGILDRKKDDTVAFADALAGLWVNTGAETVDFGGFLSTLDQSSSPFEMLPDAPSYPWQHDQVHWRESRWSMRYRTRAVPHELLGSRLPSDSDQDLRWHNILKAEEVPWLKDHRFKGQIIVPAAAYCAIALQAASSLVGDQEIQTIELRQLDLESAITLKENSVGVEVLSSLHPHADNTGDLLLADFSCSAGPADGSLPFKKICSATLAIKKGPLSSDCLPPRERQRPTLHPLDLERFYQTMSGIGLEYTGSFHGLKSAERCLNTSSAVVGPPSEPNAAYFIHPTTLDVCFQTLFTAYAAPGDGAIWTSFLPRHIHSLTVSVLDSRASIESKANLVIDTHVTDTRYPDSNRGASIVGDMQILSEKTNQTVVQIEGLEVLSFNAGNEQEKKEHLSYEVWRPDVTEGVQVPSPTPCDDATMGHIDACRRIAHFYFRELLRQVPVEQFVPAYKKLPAVAAQWVEAAAREHQNWESDTELEVDKLVSEYKQHVDVQIARTVGERLPSIVRGNIVPSQDESISNLLQQLPTRGLGSIETHKQYSQLVEQLAHKYSNLHVLEIGATTGDATLKVLEGLGDTFARYTVSTSSDDALEKLRLRLVKISPKLDFQKLNIQAPIKDQGLSPQAYDLVVISDPLIDMEFVVPQTRGLIRPGGYLIMESISNKNLRSTILKIAAEGQVQHPQELEDQVQEPRQPYSVNKTPLEWDAFLRKSSFSGIDAIVHDHSDETYRISSVILAQAVDDRINFLRRPLQVAAPSDVSKHVLIVGGSTLETHQLIEALSLLLNGKVGKITKVDSFAKMKKKFVKKADVLLCLEDLDEPFLRSFTDDSWERMKATVQSMSSVIWVLRGAREDNPYHSGVLGMGRSIAAEHPHIYFQFLDLQNLKDSERLIAQSLLRLIFARSNELKTDKTLLWKLEQEVAVEDSVVVPRVRRLREANQRLNSLREISYQPWDLEKGSLHLEVTDGQVSAISDSAVLTTNEASDGTRLQLEASLVSLKAVKMNKLQAFVGIASDPVSSKRYLVALDKNEPRPTVSPLQAVEIDGECDDVYYLQQSIGQMVAEKLLSMAPSTGTVVIHEAGSLAEPIYKSLLAFGKTFAFISRQTGVDTSSFGFASTYIHPMASKRTILNSIPRDATLFVDFVSSSNSAGHDVRSLLPSGCISAAAEDFLAKKATPLMSEPVLADLQRQLASLAPSKPSRSDLNRPLEPWSQLAVSTLLNNASEPRPFALVDWKSDQQILVKSTLLDATTLFSSTKTYLMVGLTGELGLSICSWMVRNGAKNIVLSSRSAKVDPKWKQEMIALGATIRLEQCDVTNKSQVADLKARVHNKPYPIAGVFNGAMVMEDVPFPNMSAETMRKVLRPKVNGTRFLDEVFWSDPLDFFIVTSSTAAVVGSPGQANYASGNQYMAGVMANRRKRGVAGTAVDYGLIAGVGFIRMSGRQASIEHFITKQHVEPIAESEVHAVLAEAIAAGRPGANGHHELMTCLRNVNLSDPSQQPSWLYNPRFSHLLYESATATGEGAAGGEIGAGTKSSLTSAQNVDEVTKMLLEAFTAQLATILQTTVGRVKPSVPLVDLGIDSLVAVEIRSWFLTFTNQDVPVLTILGGASVTELCAEVAPNVFESIGSADDQADAEVASASLPTESSAVPAPAHIGPGSSSKQSVKWLADVSSDDEDSDSDSEDEGQSSTLGDSSRLTPNTEVESRTPAATKGPMPPWQSVEPQSFGQSRIWFPSLYADDPSTYNCTTSYRLNGPLDLDAFKRAVWAVTQRHESLRTAFHTDSFTGEGMQDVLFMSPFRLHVVESANDSSDVDAEFKRLAAYNFDLENGESFTATVLVHAPDYATVVFGYHHIVIDGVSWQLILQDIERHYSKPHPKPPAPSQYPAFAKKQRQLLKDGKFDNDINFWKSEFATLPEPLPLFPFANVSERQAVTSYESIELVKAIEPALMAKVKQASLELKTTTFHLHLAAVQVLLHRHLDVEDLCLGIVDANRTDKEHLSTVGFMLNMLPLRLRLDEDQSFAEIAKATRAKVYSALGRSAVPFEVILDSLNAPRAPGTTPLFQVMVNYRMGALKQKTIGNLGLEFLDYAEAKNPYDISVTIDEKDDGSGGYVSLSLPSYMFSKDGGQLIMESYLNLLDALVTDTSLSVGEPALYGSEQLRPAIDLGTGSKLPTEWPDTLSQQIEQLAKDQPDSVAAKDSTGKSLTYDMLVKRANSIAVVMEPRISAGALISVLCEPSVDFICVLIAIMRLGAVYVPLDSSLPDERLRLITEEAQPSIVVYDNSTGDRVRNIAPTGSDVISIDSLPSRAVKSLPDQSKPDSNAFVLFTSGTTGRPKGVQLTHANYLHHVLAASHFLKLGKEVVLQQSSVGFDLSLAQIFYGLANGGTVIVAGMRRDPAHLTELMLKHGVTFTFCVPSEYSLMMSYNLDNLRACTSWRLALSSGESFPASLKDKFRSLDRTDFRVVNGYGPTEASVNASMGDVDISTGSAGGKVSIGKTLQNYSVYILDGSGNPTPVGCSGEIVLGGPGISPGYLKMEELTAQRFIQDTVSPESRRAQGWKYLYRTGDKGQMSATGEFTYQGRIEGDSQVKLNGVRIELEDIENTIMKHAKGAFSEVAVIVKGDTERFAVALTTVTPGWESRNPANAVKKFLSTLPLPSYMKPAMLETIEAMPLSASGKLDRKALDKLPLKNFASPAQSSLADTSSTLGVEKQLSEIWTQLLSGTGQNIQIENDTDFFATGGSSLLLLRLQAEIRATFDLDLPLPELFKLTRFDALAARISSKNTSAAAKDFVTLDWDEETQVPQAVITAHEQAVPHIPKKKDAPISVALTGATGFLGQALLQALINEPSIETIHCLAIRSRNNTTTTTPSSPLLTHAKVHLHPGDLSQPNLGLPSSSIPAIFSSLSAIIHNGADVSFLKDFASLRAANVSSTKELTRLAPGVPLHFISTAGVALLSNKPTFPETSLAQFPPQTDGGNGYVASKWASERFLERLVATGVGGAGGVWIHRPSSITGPGFPSLDIVNNLVKYSRKLSAVPDLSGWEGHFDFVDVRTVADGVVRRLLLEGVAGAKAASDSKAASRSEQQEHEKQQQQQQQQNKVTYVHHCGDDVVPVSQLAEYVARTTEKEGGMVRVKGEVEVEVLRPEEWLARALDGGMHELVGGYMRGAMGGAGSGGGDGKGRAPTATLLVKGKGEKGGDV